MLENQLHSLEEKCKELEKTANICQKEYETSCVKMGIKGENVENEITQLVNKLPTFLEKIVTEIQKKETSAVIQYYYEFSVYTTKVLNSKVRNNTHMDKSVHSCFVWKKSFKMGISCSSSMRFAKRKNQFPRSF